MKLRLIDKTFLSRNLNEIVILKRIDIFVTLLKRIIFLIENSTFFYIKLCCYISTIIYNEFFLSTFDIINFDSRMSLITNILIFNSSII